MQVTHIHWRRPDLERSGTVAIGLDGFDIHAYILRGARPQFDDALKVFEAALDQLRPEWRDEVRRRYNRIGKFRVIERAGQSGCCSFQMVEPTGQLSERTTAAWYISCLGRIAEHMAFGAEAMPVMWPSNRSSPDLVIRTLGEPTYEVPKALEYWGTSDWMPKDELADPADTYARYFAEPTPSPSESEPIIPPLSRTLEPVEGIVRVPLEALED